MTEIESKHGTVSRQPYELYMFNHHKDIEELTGLDAKGQVKLFIELSQLAGHPVIYDILPQTGRFSKAVLANPHIARWFDIPELDREYAKCVEDVMHCLEISNRLFLTLRKQLNSPRLTRRLIKFADSAINSSATRQKRKQTSQKRKNSATKTDDYRI